MRRFWFISLLLLALLLAGCQPKLEEGVTKVVSGNNFFDTTPTASAPKTGDSDALAKVVSTSTPVPAYPTALPTYLATSRIVTYSPGGPGSATATLTTIPPTSTPIKTNTPTSASTSPAATNTPTTAATATTAKTNTPTTAPTAVSTTTAYLYTVQSGSPVQIQNFVNSTAGCAWQGIAGQVFDNDSTPVKNIVVKAGGTWNGATVNLLGMTGAASNYGEGGYELVLGTKVVATNNTVWVQLYDLAGKALTEKVYVSTSTDCTKNLVLLNFKEIAGGFDSYVPLVIQTTTP